MKKFSLSLILTIFTLVNIFAGNASFILEMPVMANYVVRFDGGAFPFYGKQFSFDQFNGGVHQLSISRKDGPLEIPFYNGIVNFENNYRIFGAIDNFGRFSVVKKETIQEYCPPQAGGYPHDPGNPYTPQQPYYQPFTRDQDVTDLCVVLKDAWYDSKREEITKQAIKHNNYSAGQVTTILKEFDYDSYRLRVAKEAYNYSNDKGNFFKINSAFDYSSSISDLAKYIKLQDN